ncbi:MAG: YjjG family noncanonical pyrimidine nucleotidase [Clostridia bacterium]|nr:YjjG family noncanonical pyrimidine nucleotidase [Clostridia bacterium]
MYKYLLFDADNTLLDFDAAEKSALADTLKMFPVGFSEKTHKRYHEINKEEWEKLERRQTDFDRLRVNRFVRLMREFGCPGEDGKKAAEIYEGRLGEYAPLMPDAETVLERLSRKYDIYIITNGISAIQRSRLEKTDFDLWIKGCFISQEMGVSKPDKRFFDTVTEKIGDCDLSKYLVIGDSLTSDISGAYNYGIDSVWYTSQKRTDSRPKYTVSSLTELFEFL